MNVFNLPIDEIIDNEKKQSFCHHYCYFNGKQEISFSHNRGSFEVDTFNKDDNNDKYVKHWEVKNITKSTINALNERINIFLNKLNITDKFYDIWEYREYREAYKNLKEKGILETPNGKTLEITLRYWDYNEKGEKVEIHKPYTITTKNLVSDDEILVHDKTLQFHYITFDSLVNIIKFMEDIV